MHGASNVDERVREFLGHVEKQSRIYKTSNLIMTFGNDFTFSQSAKVFRNIDKLIEYANIAGESLEEPINVMYSTPACYLKALNQVRNIDWETKYDDFFPYADNPQRYWTGFFTSRPALKYNVRRTGSYLQAVRQLAAWSQLSDVSSANSIGELERAMSTVQHHDGVSGTEKQHVANDYARQMWIGVEKCLGVIDFSVQNILKNKLSQTLKGNKFVYCPLLNATECPQLENQESFTVLVYNPLGWKVNSWITLPVDDVKFKVTDVQTNKPVVVESVTAEIYKEEKLIVERRSNAKYRLVFAAELPALGFKTYRVEKSSSSARRTRLRSLQKVIGNKFNVKNNHIDVNFDEAGNLVGVTNLDRNITMDVKQSFCFYKSNLRGSGSASGAYSFKLVEFYF